MSFLPWRSFEVRTQLNRGDALRLLQQATPACVRLPDLIGQAPYFCGTVHVGAGSFRFERNTFSRWRIMFPKLSGRLSAADEGTVVSVSVAPSPSFWFVLMIVCFFLAFIPLGLLLWLFDMPMHEGSPLGFVVVPLLSVMCLGWMWIPLVLVTYSSLPTFEKEFRKLLDRIDERTTEGIFILDVPETPEQLRTKRRLRKRAAQNAMKIVAIVLVGMGVLLAAFGVNGVLTESVTFHNSPSEFRQPHERSPGVTLTGTRAVTAGMSATALGSGLALVGGVCWLLSRRNPYDRSWPLLDTALLAVSIGLLVLGAVLGFKSLW